MMSTNHPYPMASAKPLFDPSTNYTALRFARSQLEVKENKPVGNIEAQRNLEMRLPPKAKWI
jgi:hypothetical protein